jgi:hypothetical protein
MFQMLRQKLSNLGMLQKPAHGSRSLHEREKLEIAQIHVDATELTHLVRRGADNTDWLSSKIVVNLGRIEVLETTTSGDRPKGRNATSSDSS